MDQKWTKNPILFNASLAETNTTENAFEQIHNLQPGRRLLGKPPASFYTNSRAADTNAASAPYPNLRS